ncbi:hypothetical protein OGAPHI_003101 [Ogataea philodendri]|uniref:Aldehyde dehydrogenase 5, mitochondrial n=1 Tax=Ogataea philodendri TaxID=1378263 RepID=A0A9P8P9W1_9ASCO|nr:uncharacterized protein OGAPHI_003101 [Ogataea philodendri]KAH3667452.1 hypothetical protein OGAPHI_003101 [Ogataea philodendri]
MAHVQKLTFPIINKSYEQPTGLFINNEFVAAKSGKTFKVTSPITEDLLCDVQQAEAEDVDIAVNAAYKAFKSWKFVNPTERARLLWKLADLVERDRDLLAQIESLDNGKSLQCAQWDLNIVINYLRSCAGFCEKKDGRLIDTGYSHMTYTKREPLGVCGAITPWNFPLMMFAWKIGPSLATGNCVVLKPASATPLSNLYACKLVKEAGIPAGVVNVIPGSGRGCGNAILNHPLVKKVAFTGSTGVGKNVMTECAKSIKKVTLELGGKSPNIVFEDCNEEEAIQNLITGIFFNGGEVCCAGSRIYIQATNPEWYNSFLQKFKAAVEKLKVGNPFEQGTYQGAQTTPDQFDEVLKYIDIGKKTSLKLLTGGNRIGNKGYFVEPTVFYDVPQDSELTQEEIFGPVAVVLPFKTVDEVIEKANDSDFGLGSGIHTEDIHKALYVSDRLEAGSVWINTYSDFHQSVPFGGYKQSGIGREMGDEAYENYTQVKAVRAKIRTPVL